MVNDTAGRNVGFSEADRQRAVMESSNRNFSELHKAILALEFLGQGMEAEKANYEEIRKFIREAVSVAAFKATELDISDVIREAREADGGRVQGIAARVADVKLGELKEALRERGEQAGAEIDARRLALHERYEELRPEFAHMDAQGAVDLDKVEGFKEFRQLHREWEVLRGHEFALLRSNTLPSERSHANNIGRVRIGHNAWYQREGKRDLEIGNAPAAVAYAEAKAALEAPEGRPEVSGYNPLDPFDPNRPVSNIPPEQNPPVVNPPAWNT